jgi:hypothetical protein
MTMPRSLSTFFSVCALLLSSGSAALAATLPAPSFNAVLPAPSANSFSVSAVYGPTDGLLYVWNGTQILKQNAPLTNSYTSIGNVGSGSADAGALAFSRNGAELLAGNGAGGFIGGVHSGLIFSIPSAGGNSNTAVGNVPFHDQFLAAPLGASNNKFFIDQGNASFTASSVSVFDNTNGSNVPVIANIPGASTSMTLDGLGNFYVGVGFGPSRGQIRSFNLAALENAYNTSTPLDWTTGTVFNALDNNSGAGMFFDARGYLFVGGPNGVRVFDGQGHSMLYDNGDFTSIVYDRLNDRVLVTGFGDNQGVYEASIFQVPEPSSVVLMLVAALALTPAVRRRCRSRLSA